MMQSGSVQPEAAVEERAGEVERHAPWSRADLLVAGHRELVDALPEGDTSGPMRACRRPRRRPSPSGQPQARMKVSSPAPRRMAL